MELEAVRNQLKESEIKASRPSPLLLQLQREMAELKVCNEVSNLTQSLYVFLLRERKEWVEGEECNDQLMSFLDILLELLTTWNPFTLGLKKKEKEKNNNNNNK